MTIIVTKKCIKWLTGTGTVFTVVIHSLNNNSCRADAKVQQPKPTGKPWIHNWDGKQEPYEKNKSKAFRHIFLIQHGQYNMHGDGGLTPLGQLQAKFTAFRLNELDFTYNPEILSSSLKRSKETANTLANTLGQDMHVKIDEILNDGVAIEPDPPLLEWREIETGEKPMDFYQDGPRLEKAFRSFFYRPDPDSLRSSRYCDIIVCPANVIRYFVCRVLQLPPEAWHRMSLRNCSITWILIGSNGVVMVKGLGITGHLPPDHITSF